MKALGIFGHPISHSFSPDMHNAGLKAVGLENKYVYMPFDITPENLSDAINSIKVLDFRGLNITIPHKEEVISFLDEVDHQARLIGAVNVIVNDGGKLTGYNTDGIGFLRSMTEETGITPEGKKILILGAGGASRAVAAALASGGAEEIIIANRSKEKALSVADMVKQMHTPVRVINISGQEMKEVIKEVHIIVNTTSVGMHPNIEDSPITEYASLLHRGQLVCDIIYNPVQTLLLKQAKEQGCKIMNGLGMLLYQGVEAFKLWTSVEAPVEVMGQVLEQKLRK